MSTAPAATISISVERPPEEVYAYVSDPANLPTWAPAFARSVEQVDGDWIVTMADGRATVVFAEHNEHGVADHVVTLEDGTEVYNPLRVLPNLDGAEVQFTVFQLPDQDAEDIDAILAEVSGDLHRLREVLET